MKIEGNIITLEKGEPLLPEHNILGITIVRDIGAEPGKLYAVEKDYDEILDERYLG